MKTTRLCILHTIRLIDLLILQLLVPILIGCLLDPAQMKVDNIDADRHPTSAED